MNAVIYARVSTEDQVELSIPAQVQAMRDHAKRRGWTVVGEFLEPGVSGRSVERRQALQALLARCRTEPRVEVVLVHKIDRLARNIRDHANIRFQLAQNKVQLASVVENVDDSISGQLLENIMASIAQFYSGNLGQEVRKGMRMRVAQGGWPHPPPRGYKMIYDGGRRDRRGEVVHSDDAPLIRLAFEQYATRRYSYQRLRQFLATRGLVASNGKPIPQSGIESLLKNPFYAGRVRWGGEEFKGNHVPLVSEALFLEVQRIIASRPKDHGEKGRQRFFLRGIAFCAVCDGKLTAERHDRWTYYRCIRRSIAPESCDAQMSNGSFADGDVRRICQRLRVSADLRREVLDRVERLLATRGRQREHDLKSLKARKQKAEEQESRLAEAFADGDMSRRAYGAASRRVRANIVGIENSLGALDQDPKELKAKITQVLTVADSIQSLAQTIGDEGRYRLVRAVFSRISLLRGKVTAYRLRPPLDRLLSEEEDDGPLLPDLDERQVSSTIETIIEVDSGHLLDKFEA